MVMTEMLTPGQVAQSVTRLTDYRSRGRELDPGLVPYFSGD